MPAPYHHFRYREFKDSVSAAKLDDAHKIITCLEEEHARARQQASDLKHHLNAKCNQILAQHYAALRPHLRPCHQKRFDTGDKQVELDYL